MQTLRTAQVPPPDLFERFLAGGWKIYLPLAVLLGAAAGVVAVRAGEPVYVLVGLAGLFAFLGSVISAEFGLVVLIFLAYTRFSDVAVHTYGAISILQVFMVLQVVAILLRWAVAGKAPMGWLLPTLMLAAYGLAATSSILNALDSSLVLDALVVFLKDAVIAVVIVLLLQRPAAFRQTLWVLIGAGIFLGTLSSYQFLTKTFTNTYGGFATASLQTIIGQQNDYRIGGPIGDPNFFAQILIVIVPIALERSLHEKRMLLRGLALWCALVCVGTTVFTYSRGGFLSLAAVILIFFVIYPPRMFQLPIFLLSFVVVALLIPPNYWERILSLNQYFQTPGTIRTNDPALRGRATENLAALGMFEANPLLGVGWGNYSVAYPTYEQNLGISIANRRTAAHNLYLEVAAETGTAGLVTFLALIGAAVQCVLGSRRRLLQSGLKGPGNMVTGFGLGLLGYLTSALFIHGAYPRYFYLLIGIAFALREVVRNARPEQSAAGELQA